MVLLVLEGSVPDTRHFSNVNAHSKCKTLTKELEVALATHELVETDIGLDGNTRSRVAEVRVVT